MSELIINRLKDKVIICVLEENHIVERYVQSNTKESLMGNIYVGIVENVLDGMQAAFVDIGTERNAFIYDKDVLPKVNKIKGELSVNIKISDMIQKGQKVFVQVKKDVSEEKGARVSTHITLAGKYIVLMPNIDIITVSQKIEEKEEKERLLQIVKQNLPKEFGAIIRTDAREMEEAALKEDIETLVKLWTSLQKSKKQKGLVYDDNRGLNKVLRDIVNQKTEVIYCNDKKDYEAFIQNKIDFLSKVEIRFFENVDIFEKFGLKTEYEKIDYRKVWLRCGGDIVLDKTEALTAIDVNSGRYILGKSLELTAFKVNQEAAYEIMRQIRLRDIGGIIIVDFIDMKEKEHKRKILEIMKEEAKKDRAKVDIKDFTKLNLLELTRKKLYTEN